jgi:hypothetical protein
LVHIGLAKAASTFLQLELFPNLTGVHNMGKHLVSEDLKKASMALTRLTSVDWPRKADITRPAFRSALDEAQSKGVRPVFSEEDLSVYKFLDPEIMARRMKTILGAYDVLLIIRNPFSWVPSNYLFRLQHQNAIAVMGFEEWLETHLSVQRIGSDVAEIWFAKLANIYQETCGGQVHIVPFELMRSDPAMFAEKLSSIIGADSGDVLNVLKTPQKRRAHKIRITQAQRNLYETFRWIELRQPERFVTSILRVAKESDRAILPEHQIALNELLVSEQGSREDWSRLLEKISRSWPSDDPAARPEIPAQLATRMEHVTKASLSELRSNYGFDLAEFGLSYGP